MHVEFERLVRRSAHADGKCGCRLGAGEGADRVGHCHWRGGFRVGRYRGLDDVLRFGRTGRILAEIVLRFRAVAEFAAGNGYGVEEFARCAAFVGYRKGPAATGQGRAAEFLGIGAFGGFVVGRRGRFDAVRLDLVDIERLRHGEAAGLGHAADLGRFRRGLHAGDLAGQQEAEDRAEQCGGPAQQHAGRQPQRRRGCGHDGWQAGRGDYAFEQRRGKHQEPDAEQGGEPQCNDRRKCGMRGNRRPCRLALRSVLRSLAHQISLSSRCAPYAAALATPEFGLGASKAW